MKSFQVISYSIAFPLLWQEFESWINGLSEKDKQDATGFFNVIRRNNYSHFNNTSDLHIIPYSKEYSAFLAKAAEILHKAGDLTSSTRYRLY